MMSPPRVLLAAVAAANSGKGYTHKHGCLAGFESVKRNASTAKIEQKE